jgi:hypothetical protein
MGAGMQGIIENIALDSLLTLVKDLLLLSCERGGERDDSAPPRTMYRWLRTCGPGS